MEELRAKLAEIDAIINTEQQRGSMADQGKIATLQQQYQEVQAQINQLEVEGVTQAIAPSAESITIGDDTFTIESLALDEDSAMVLRQGLRQIRTQVAEKANAWVNDLQSVKSEYESKLAEKENALQAANTQIDALQDENGKLQLENADLSEKRDNAANQLKEAQAEIERLNSHIDDLRKDIAVGAIAAPNVIEIESDADLEAAAQRLKAKKAEKAKADAEAAEAAKIRIYDVQKGDNATTFYTARRADNDELIEIRPYYAINQYVQLSDDELARFREDHKVQAAAEMVQPVEAVPVAEEPNQSVEVPPMGDSFQEETNGHGVAQGASGETGTVDGKATEARLAALEARVEALENVNRAVAA